MGFKEKGPRVSGLGGVSFFAFGSPLQRCAVRAPFAPWARSCAARRSPSVVSCRCRFSLMRLFLTLGASLIREESGQVADSKPIAFGRPDLEWSLLATFWKRALHPKAFQLLAAILEGWACTKSEEEPTTKNDSGAFHSSHGDSVGCGVGSYQLACIFGAEDLPCWSGTCGDHLRGVIHVQEYPTRRARFNAGREGF
jgi:hypothetical protein